jgi:hypothetical protein
VQCNRDMGERHERQRKAIIRSIDIKFWHNNIGQTTLGVTLGVLLELCKAGSSSIY